MAEIEAASRPGKRGGRRAKKLSTRIDLTPMVDLGFLLITFFIFTTTSSAPQVLKLRMPADGPSTMLGESRSLTVIPINNRELFYYDGRLDQALQQGLYGFTGYGTANGLGDLIRQKQSVMNKRRPGLAKELMLVIKPAGTASYGNLVRVMDEVLINEVKYYALVDMAAEDKSAIETARH